MADYNININAVGEEQVSDPVSQYGPPIRFEGANQLRDKMAQVLSELFSTSSQIGEMREKILTENLREEADRDEEEALRERISSLKELEELRKEHDRLVAQSYREMIRFSQEAYKKGVDANEEMARMREAIKTAEYGDDIKSFIQQERQATGEEVPEAPEWFTLGQKMKSRREDEAKERVAQEKERIAQEREAEKARKKQEQEEKRKAREEEKKIREEEAARARKERETEQRADDIQSMIEQAGGRGEGRQLGRIAGAAGGGAFRGGMRGAMVGSRGGIPGVIVGAAIGGSLGSMFSGAKEGADEMGEAATEAADEIRTLQMRLADISPSLATAEVYRQVEELRILMMRERLSGPAAGMISRERTNLDIALKEIGTTIEAMGTKFLAPILALFNSLAIPVLNKVNELLLAILDSDMWRDLANKVNNIPAIGQILAGVPRMVALLIDMAEAVIEANTDEFDAGFDHAVAEFLGDMGTVQAAPMWDDDALKAAHNAEVGGAPVGPQIAGAAQRGLAAMGMVGDILRQLGNAGVL